MLKALILSFILNSEPKSLARFQEFTRLAKTTGLLESRNQIQKRMPSCLRFHQKRNENACPGPPVRKLLNNEKFSLKTGASVVSRFSTPSSRQKSENSGNSGEFEFDNFKEKFPNFGPSKGWKIFAQSVLKRIP